MKLFDKEITICYEDNHLLIACKPSFLLTQQDDSSKPSLETVLRKQTGLRFLFVTHRLDFETSGLVILAKSSKALKRMHEKFRLKQIEKTYLALVSGEGLKQGCLKHHYQKKEGRPYLDTEGVLVHLDYQCLHAKDNISLLKIQLHTGKKHQIRLQLAHIGYPVIGDCKYGPETKSKCMMLCHFQVSFIHPVTLETLKVEAPFPDWVDRDVKQDRRLLEASNVCPSLPI